MITTHCNKSYVKLVVSLSISLYCRYFQTVVDPGVTETMETTARDEGVTANWASPATRGTKDFLDYQSSVRWDRRTWENKQDHGKIATLQEKINKQIEMKFITTTCRTKFLE